MKENKATGRFGAFSLFSLLIISTEDHFPEQSCKVNDDIFTFLWKKSQITSLVLLRPQWVIPLASWMEWGYFHDILFFNMFSFLTNLSVLLLFTYISIQYIELCNVCQVLVTNLLYSLSVWCHTQYIIYFCFLGQTVQTLIWSHRKGLTNTAKG